MWEAIPVSSIDMIVRKYEVRRMNRESRKVTCADRIVVSDNKMGFCRAGGCPEDKYVPLPRCIDVPVNVCRMKPVDVVTGKPIKRKFVVTKEGVTAEWWKEGSNK